MTEDLIPPVIGLLTTILALVSSGFALLFRTLVKVQSERAERAERQVDTLVPAVQEMARAFKDLTDEIRREADRRLRS